MRVSGLQTDIAWEDPEANFATLKGRIAAAAAAGADLVVLPEMYATGFSMAADRVAEQVDGPSSAFLVEQAAAHGIRVCGSVPERSGVGGRPRNVLVLAGPGGVEARYAKIHPFSYSGEEQHYEAGTQHAVATVGGVRLGLFVCYDLRFADEFWALATEVDAYVVVANWPAARVAHWSALLRARAIENQAYVIGVNRVGTDGNGLAYTGDSAIVDPMGAVLATGAGQETMLLADLDPAVVAQTRARFPFLGDRR